MSGAWFPPDVMLGIQAKEFNLGFIRLNNLVSHGLRDLWSAAEMVALLEGAPISTK